MQKPLEQRAFLTLLAVVTVLFAVVLRPFWSAIFWSVVITVLFAPMQTELQRRMGGGRTRTALVMRDCCKTAVFSG